MKNRSYANRGQDLEDYLRFANERYRNKGVAFLHKNATEFLPIRDRRGKIISCKVEGKATIDFIGRYKDFPIAVEAKKTVDGAIRWNAVQPNQAQDMDDFCREQGTIGLVVVSFNMERFFAIPWAFWSAAYEIRVFQNDKQTPVTIEAHGQKWTVPQKFSVRIEELNPEWEIPAHDYTYGLHYLEKAENYVKTAFNMTNA